jgi:putative aldouronate transport system permease protein
MIISLLTAYPLSKQPREFPQRTVLIWFFFVTMLFSGGLIPLYATVYQLHMIDTMWVLIIPNALSVWSIVLLLNFIRTLPKEVNESAYIDGAGEWTILWKIIVPLTKPVLATLTLFTAVYHWNSWFDGLVFITSPSKIPLQTYLQSIVVQIDTTKLQNMSETDLRIYTQVSNLTFQSAQIFVAMLPILCFYPFLQKYFVKGIVMGSVKE